MNSVFHLMNNNWGLDGNSWHVGVTPYSYLYITETKLCPIVAVVSCVLSDERAGQGTQKSLKGWGGGFHPEV